MKCDPVQRTNDSFSKRMALSSFISSTSLFHGKVNPNVTNRLPNPYHLAYIGRNLPVICNHNPQP